MVDGLYAIAMTLLALEIPGTFDDYFKHVSHVDSLPHLLKGLYSVSAYVLVFLVIYELWCYHRSILSLMHGEKSRHQSLIAGVILAVICLVPAWCSFVITHYTELLESSRLIRTQSTTSRSRSAGCGLRSLSG